MQVSIAAGLDFPVPALGDEAKDRATASTINPKPDLEDPVRPEAET